MTEVHPETLLPRVDYAGSVSGAKRDKSGLFAYELTEGGAPVITDTPLSIECTVEDIYHTKGFESFICSIDAVLVEEGHQSEAGPV